MVSDPVPTFRGGGLLSGQKEKKPDLQTEGPVLVVTNHLSGLYDVKGRVAIYFKQSFS